MLPLQVILTGCVLFVDFRLKRWQPNGKAKVCFTVEQRNWSKTMGNSGRKVTHSSLYKKLFLKESLVLSVY